MGFSNSQTDKKSDVLKDLITYFASTVDHLPEVKLDKLIYIAQLYHYSNCGELLNKTRFFSLSYGPHAPIIRSTLKKQLENKTNIHGGIPDIPRSGIFKSLPYRKVKGTQG